MKKRVGLLLVVTLLFLGMPVYAQTNDSGLEKAINGAKSRISIPPEYTEFDYTIRQSEEGGSLSIYSLNWTTQDGEAGISVEIDEAGNIQSYNKYGKEEKHSGFGTVTKEKAQSIAQSFIDKVRPDLKGKVRLLEYDGSGDQQMLTYGVNENGIDISFERVRVNVDKYTGEVVNFTGPPTNKLILPPKDNIIDKQEAKKGYLSAKGVELKYHSNYDYKKKKLNVFAAYGVNDSNLAVDAKTGKVISLLPYHDFYTDRGGIGRGNQVGGEKLSKAENEAVESTAGLISKEKAVESLKAYVSDFASMQLTHSQLSKDQIDQTYNWDLQFDKGYAEMNAKTGEINSFSLYEDSETETKGNMTSDAAKEKANAFIATLPGAAEKQRSMREIPNKTHDVLDSTAYLGWERIVGNIPFADNFMTVAVNRNTGKITQYDCVWYDSVDFPKINNTISASQAFDLMDQDGKFELSYVKVKENEATLAYQFQQPISYYVDPISGGKLNKDGTPYKQAEITSYNDIKGHWCESTVNALLENGYYLEGYQFNPSNKITQEQFLRYLYSPQQANYSSEEFYRMLANNGMVNESEKDSKAQLLRQDAAKFAVRYLGQQKSACHPELFINPYSDQVNPEYRGYVAICYGLGIMKGDTNGRFLGEQALTNAEAAVIIYNVLQNL